MKLNIRFLTLGRMYNEMEKSPFMNQNNKIASINSKNTIEVHQREFAITSSKNSRHIIGTTRIETCICFSGFDKESEVGFLAHIDFWWVALWQINRVFMELKSFGLKPDNCFKAQLIGGRRNYPLALSRLKRLILKSAAKKAKRKIGLNIHVIDGEWTRSYLTYSFDTAKPCKHGKYYKNANLRESNKSKLYNLFMPLRSVSKLKNRNNSTQNYDN